MIKRLLIGVLVTALTVCTLCSASASRAQVTIVFVVKDEAIDGDGHISSKSDPQTALDEVIDAAEQSGMKLTFFFATDVKYDGDYIGAMVKLHTSGQSFGTVYSNVSSAKTALIYQKYAVKYASRLVLGDGKSEIPSGIGLCSYTYDIYCAAPQDIADTFNENCDKKTVAIEINNETAADIVALLGTVGERYTVISVTETGKLTQGKAE